MGLGSLQTPLRAYSAAMASVTLFTLIIKGIYKLIKGRRERERIVYVPVTRRVSIKEGRTSFLPPLYQ